MAFYWRGLISLGGDGSELLTRFFEKAHDRLRANAIEYIGRSLENTKEDVPPEIQKRLVAFWNWRLADARETAPGRELAAFGWWLASKKLDSQWAIAQLLEILKAGSKIDPDFLVLEYLADVAPQLPLAVTDHP